MLSEQLTYKITKFQATIQNQKKISDAVPPGKCREDMTQKRERALVRNVSSLCALSTCKGRLPTLPLSQYHRRDEA